MEQDFWTIHSQSKRQKILPLYVAAFGVTLFIIQKFHLFTGIEKLPNWTAPAVIGFAILAWLIDRDIVTTIYTSRKEVLIQKISPLSTTSRAIPFSDISSVEIRHFLSQNRPRYSIYLRLQSRKKVSTGKNFIKKSDAEELAKKISNSLGIEYGFQPLNLFSTKKITIAATMALITYALWFRIFAGPFCSAMWHGTAPVFIMGIVFFTAIISLHNFFD